MQGFVESSVMSWNCFIMSSSFTFATFQIEQLNSLLEQNICITCQFQSSCNILSFLNYLIVYFTVQTVDVGIFSLTKVIQFKTNS